MNFNYLVDISAPNSQNSNISSDLSCFLALCWVVHFEMSHPLHRLRGVAPSRADTHVPFLLDLNPKR